MIDEQRVTQRINWVYEGLRQTWLHKVTEACGNYADNIRREYPNMTLIQKGYGYLHSCRIPLGHEDWECVELALHEKAPPDLPAEFRSWVNVREFQRDITTWLRVWTDIRFDALYADTRSIHLSTLITLLVAALHSLAGAVEVMVTDPDDQTIAIWIRLKSYPNSFYVCATIPKLTSHQLHL